jgi:hypothetical protein
MPMDSVTEENVEHLFSELKKKETELETIKQTSENQMWLNELNNLKTEYISYREERARMMSGEANNKNKIIKKTQKIAKQIVVEE